MVCNHQLLVSLGLLILWLVVLRLEVRSSRKVVTTAACKIVVIRTADGVAARRDHM